MLSWQDNATALANEEGEHPLVHGYLPQLRCVKPASAGRTAERAPFTMPSIWLRQSRHTDVVNGRAWHLNLRLGAKAIAGQLISPLRNSLVVLGVHSSLLSSHQLALCLKLIS